MGALMAGLGSGERFGDFEILGRAGEGGMGVVYMARQLSLGGRRVALKVISPEIAGAADFRARFEHESRIAASIDHPHVISIYAAGEHDGHPYIAMQWVEGKTLYEELAHGPLAPTRAVTAISQIAGALDVAHTAGLVHRDVKPANILLRSIGGRDHAYLTDFGIAKRTQVEATNLTRTGNIVGTIGYMAPEQIQGQRGDGRSDIYSLGCVLYECLTGKRPFERENEMATLWAHVHDPRPSPSAVKPGLPRGLDAVVARALAIDPGERYQTGGELAAAAAAVALGGEPTAAGSTAARLAEPTATAPAPPTPATVPEPQPAGGPTAPAAGPAGTAGASGRGRPWLGYALAALVVLAGIGVGGFAVAGGFKGSSNTVITGAGGNGGGGGGGSGHPNRGGGGGSQSVAPAQRQIVGVLDRYETAYTDQSTSQLSALFTTDITRHGLRQGGCSVTRGIDQVLQTYQEQFNTGSGAYRLTNLNPSAITVSGSQASTIPLSYQISSGASGSVTFDFRRTGSQWLISAVDASC